MIIVTGGAGFIGSYLVGTLSDKGMGPIIVCDRLRNGDKWKNIAKHNVADIIDPDDLLSWLEDRGQNVDCIFHLGACSSTTETDADFIWRNNVKFTQDLWDWCSQNQARLIYASSAATYGDGNLGFDDDEAIEAINKLKPLNPYGWSKKVSDQRAVQMASAGYAPRQWAGLKFFNVYGPNEYHKGGQKSVAVQLYDQILETGEAVLFASHHPDYEDGGQMRDFVWVGDVVDIMLWLYENHQTSGIFNCGSGKARSFKDLALAIFAAMGLNSKISYRDTPEHIRKHYQYFTEANMTKLQDEGYKKAGTSLEDGVADYVKNYLANDDIYR